MTFTSNWTCLVYTKLKLQRLFLPIVKGASLTQSSAVDMFGNQVRRDG